MCLQCYIAYIRQSMLVYCLRLIERSSNAIWRLVGLMLRWQSSVQPVWTGLFKFKTTVLRQKMPENRKSFFINMSQQHIIRWNKQSNTGKRSKMVFTSLTILFWHSFLSFSFFTRIYIHLFINSSTILFIHSLFIFIYLFTYLLTYLFISYAVVCTMKYKTR